MNNKILAIGSIIACIIILLATLSPVVGYNSARSSVKDSPLFSVRTKRAINQQNDGLSCEYVGKGNRLLLPRRNEGTALIQKIIEDIIAMDDEKFNGFVNSFLSRIKENNPVSFKNEHISEFIMVLNQLRTNPNWFVFYNDNKAGNNPYTNDRTFYEPGWYPTCFVFCFIISSIFDVIIRYTVCFIYYLIHGEDISGFVL